jgi:hypothetical protein
MVRRLMSMTVVAASLVSAERSYADCPGAEVACNLSGKFNTSCCAVHVVACRKGTVTDVSEGRCCPSGYLSCPQNSKNDCYAFNNPYVCSLDNTVQCDACCGSGKRDCGDHCCPTAQMGGACCPSLNGPDGCGNADCTQTYPGLPYLVAGGVPRYDPGPAGACPGYDKYGVIISNGACDEGSVCCPRLGLDPSGKDGICCGAGMVCCPYGCDTDSTCTNATPPPIGGCALGHAGSPGGLSAVAAALLALLGVRRARRRR